MTVLRGKDWREERRKGVERVKVEKGKERREKKGNKRIKKGKEKVKEKVKEINRKMKERKGIIHVHIHG